MHDLTATLSHSDHNLFRSDVVEGLPAFKRQSHAAGCMTNGVPTCSRRSRASKITIRRARRQRSCGRANPNCDSSPARSLS